MFNDSICQGSSATVSVSGYIGTIQWQQSTDSVSWSDISGATSETITTPLLNEETFYRAAISTKMCPDAYSNNVKVSLKPLPVASFSYNANHGIVTFFDNSQNGETYFWDFGDDSTSTEKEPTHNYFSNSDFNVLQRVSNVCGSDSTTKHISISGVGINEIKTNNVISIYPNPNNGNFSVRYSSEDIGSIVIELFNIEGKLIFSQNYEKRTKLFNCEFNLNQLSKGIYQFRIIELHNVINRQVLIR